MSVFKKREILDWSSVIGISIFLLSIAVFVFISVLKNYVDENSILTSTNAKKVYILESSATKNRLSEIGGDVEAYSKHIQTIKKILKKKGFNPKIIDESNIDKITNRDVLIVIDAISLSEKTQKRIIEFVKHGGNLLFNFDTGFVDDNGKVTGTKMIETITGLKHRGYVVRNKDNTFFLVSKLLSPIKIPNGKRLDVVLYDRIPIFSGKKPNLLFVNWSMTAGMKKGNKSIPSGAVWSGQYGKGGWIYFSFPFYAMDSSNIDSKYYYKIFDEMINYLYKEIKVVAFPYVHYKKMVFISEDTEYKFTQLNNFANVIKKYDINGTAFCVGRLAEKHIPLMAKVGSIKNLEIASHSYSHTKLIDENENQLVKEFKFNKYLLEYLTDRKVVGFRPPREEMNKKMFEMLEKYGYHYILWKNFSQLEVKLNGDLVEIPRIGTDDYSYLIELDWNKNQIVSRIKKEAKFITSLNAIYTLSTHTHLMNYKSNITMLERAVQFFKKEKYPILKGRDVAFLAKQSKNIEIETTKTETNFIVKIKNKNYEDVKNLIIRLYLSKKLDILGITPELGGLKTRLIRYKNKNYIDIKIEKLRRKTDYNLFIGYR